MIVDETPGMGEILTSIRSMLRRHFPRELTALRHVSRRRDPFKVLIATILSQRTRDENTLRAVEKLFSVYPDAHALAKADLRRLRSLIRPVGFYKVKATRIRDIARIILNRYNGEVPRNIDDLLTLPSVGRKTANCVLVYGYGQPAIPVDTHVHRIANRLGIVDTATPEQTERELAEFSEREYWIEINNLFVSFGKNICRPVAPRCGICNFTTFCKYYLKEAFQDPVETSKPKSHI
jgi:endonuclease-3